MIKNLSELTNVELYDELVPIIKQLCENFFYKDINNYCLKIEDTDLFFKLYDIALDYEYSKTPNLYKSINDEGEVFFTGGGFQNVRAKKGSDIYKQIKWDEVYNNAKDILDSKHLNELVLRYVEAPCHVMPYFLNNEIFYDWIKDKNNSGDEVSYKSMLYNDPFVIDEIDKYPELHVYLGLKFGNLNEDFKWLEELFKYQVEDFAYVMLAMYRNYLCGLNGFNKSEEIAKHILEELFKREWMTDGRHSLLSTFVIVDGIENREEFRKRARKIIKASGSNYIVKEASVGDKDSRSIGFRIHNNAKLYVDNFEKSIEYLKELIKDTLYIIKKVGMFN